MKKPSGTLQFESYSLSHKGLRRENNEDRLRTVTFSTGADQSTPCLLSVLADGVGGHKGGEVAARIAVDVIGDFFLDNTHPLSTLENFVQAFAIANQTILKAARSDPALDGMGTTCVCALVIGNKLFAAHLGDSRLYLLRNNTLYQMTADHTWLEDNVRSRSAEPVRINRSHPLAHVISRYLGSLLPIDVDLSLDKPAAKDGSLLLRRGDILMLCSDGLTNLVKEPEIKQILTTCSGRKRAQTLVYQALLNGGHDNVSTIIIEAA